MPSEPKRKSWSYLPGPLRVEVDVEELPVPEHLRHRVVEREARHRLVRELGVHAHHLRMLQLVDEREHVAHRRQQDVAARLVGLGLEREAQRVPLLAHVLAREVHRFGVAVERGARVHRRVDLAPLTPTPHHEHLGAELHAEIDGVEGLGQGEATHLHVVGGERAVAEHRLREQVARGHRHAQPGLVERALEPGDDRVALGCARADGHEVVVVEADAVRPDSGQVLHRVDGVERCPHLVAERVAARVADGPETEGEVVLGDWRERVAHDITWSLFADHTKVRSW